MSVWAEIDRLRERHEAELARVREELHRVHGSALRIDEFGRWRCSWRPTRGDRLTQRFTGRTGAELLKRLTAAIAARPKRKPKKAEASG